MMACIVFTLAASGFLALALSMRRHQSIAPFLKKYRTPLQVVGWGLLTGSLFASLLQPRSSVAVVEWFFLLTAAGLPIVTAVTFAQFRHTKNKNAR